MRKSKLLYILLFCLIFIFTFCYTYFIDCLNLDEVWNYGFSYNIANGLVPYRDFNMLQNPLLFFIGSIFVNIFGNHLWSVHIFNSLLISFMMLIIYRRVGYKMFIIYPVVLVYSVYSYNMLCLFFGILILNCLDKNNKYNDYVISLLVSLVFLSKQNIGICLLVPMIVFSKNRIKSMFVFFIPILFLLLYLVINNSVYEYINYTILGMFDFGKSNGVYHFVLFYIILVGYLVYKLFKSKFKDRYIFYILAFQVVGVPIIDDYHFMIGFLLFLYYLLLIINFRKSYFKYFVVISISFVFLYLINQQEKLDDYSFYNIHLYSDKESCLYGRNVGVKTQKLVDNLSKYVIDNRDKYGDNIFLFNNWAYLVKLNIGDNLNKYDLILDGNMGYHGSEKFINELENKCMKEPCLFIVQFGGNQISIDIVKYVMDNYSEIDEIKDIVHVGPKYSKYKINYYVFNND